MKQKNDTVIFFYYDNGLPNIFLFVDQNKDICTDLEQLKRE